MPETGKIVTIQEGGFVELSQDDLTRLGAKIGDYLNVEEVGYRCIRLYKTELLEEDENIASPS